MRILLKSGKQTELILLAKADLSWKELAKIINVNEQYLCRDLRVGKRLLSKEVFIKLCNLAKNDFKKDIIKELDDDWGRSKGGTASPNNTKKFIVPKRNKDLAEIFGIILGDGHVSEIRRGKKIRVYCIRVTGNSKTDRNYMFEYIPDLFEKVFNERGSVLKSKSINGCYFTLYGKRILEFIKSVGFLPGNKIRNNQGIPEWIRQDKELLKSCMRGLIDTDGSVHIISKNNKNIRIDFTSYIPRLLSDAREGLISLGFTPCKIVRSQHIFLSKQEEIKRYVQEIGFGNTKNLNRYNQFKNYLRKKIAPVV